jgi:FMN phosphatase YigB (HAD superfamily)
MKKILLFTDLDGTLIDHHTYEGLTMIAAIGPEGFLAVANYLTNFDV